MTTQEHIEIMIHTPRAVVESINKQVKELEESMKTETAMQRSSRLPWRAQRNEDGYYEVWTRLDERPGSQNNYVVAAEIQFQDEAELIASAPNLADENNRLRNALDSIATIASCAPHDDEEKANQEFTRIMNAARAALKGGAK